ncbi:proteasome subunit alpha [Lipingzhangella sp. LS1_29]|uniref:Proteasome subunit alpha n=1 Tax=Lipingzhangella rawalii TaxID=2055835 RepID=A0ABU2H253_9ACTN|nr:proteasome subunit alpha [Lipingzhangella rawalii]MDS1268944.1 proteasome subunit alpha [Lipingzhangella rawalii]
MPFYVSPEQQMKDKADYARKGIARGRSAVVLQYDGGILLVADNPSRTLHKISEIYDRIAFAAVGRYNEFENLRLAGVRVADTHGYAYDRRDVTGRMLANFYAQNLGMVFIESSKPWEVEVVVAELGDTVDTDQLYRITFDGSVIDERDFVAMGGSAEQVTNSLREHHRKDASLEEALGAAMTALANENGGDQAPDPASLEVAVLDRSRDHRTFRRIQGTRLQRLIEARSTGDTAPTASEQEDTSDGEAGSTDATDSRE